MLQRHGQLRLNSIQGQSHQSPKSFTVLSGAPGENQYELDPFDESENSYRDLEKVFH